MDRQAAWAEAQRQAWGTRIRDARKTLKMSMGDVVDALAAQGVSVTAAAVGQWERGETTPTDWMRIHVARAVGRHPAELFAYTVPVPQAVAA